MVVDRLAGLGRPLQEDVELAVPDPLPDAETPASEKDFTRVAPEASASHSHRSGASSSPGW